MKIIFFGTPHFARDVLKHLLDNNFNIVAVVTRPDQPQGRSLKLKPSPVKQFLIEEGLDIPLFQPSKASNQEFVDILKTFKPDFFVVVGYGEILKQNLLDVPLIAPINIHTSLLPKYRGAAPIQRAIMAGEKEIGITIMQMNAHMDAGEILMQKSMNIDMDETFEQIEKKMIDMASVAICEVLTDFGQHKINSKKQDISLITHAPKIEVQDCQIDFENSAFAVQRQIMALSPKPAAWINVEISGQVKRIKIFNAVFSNKIVNKGFLEVDQGNILLGCQDGSLSINFLQPEGKSVMTAKDFINGHKIHFPIKILF